MSLDEKEQTLPPTGTPDDGAERLPRLGRFTLLDLLGRGGMADVYLAATRAKFGAVKLVVLKCVRARDGAEAEMARMFADEARLACLLSHPNVVSCYEVGVVDDESFLAMEFLDGQPLSRVLRMLEMSGVRAPAPIAARIICDVLRGLHYAHTLKGSDGRPLNIIHRDVSPANVFVTYDGAVKVLDFGIAKWALADNRTATGLIKGKLAYMAPEQALAVPLDARADIFAAGLTLWELLAGRRLHGNARAEQLLMRVLTGNVPSLSEGGVDVPACLEEIVARAVARDREGRFLNAAHFREAIEAAAASFGGIATDVEVGAFVATLFAAERERKARNVRDQLQRLDAELGPIAPAHRPRPQRAAPSEATSEAPVVSSRTTQPAHRAPNRLARVGVRALAAAAVAAFATVGALSLALAGSRGVAAPSAAAATPPSVAVVDGGDAGPR